MFQKQIDDFIDSKKEEMLEDLKALVRIDSTRAEAAPGKPFGEGPARVLEAAAGLMEKYGFQVADYDQYCVCGDLVREQKKLDILAHLDVVPVTEDWTVTGPFEPLVKDGRIYGRGTADDKGPAIAALYAMRAVNELKLPLKYGVRLILGSDEECGSSDLRYYYEKEEEAPCTFTPDADFPLINLEKARLSKSFSADVSGDEDAAGEKGGILLSLQAGDKVNVVPGKAEAVIRSIPAEELEKCWEKYLAGLGDSVMKASFTKTDAGVRVLIKGMAAHASTPELGENALTGMLAFLSGLPLHGAAAAAACAVSELFPHRDTTGRALGVAMADDISGELTMNLGILRIEGGKLYGEFDSRAPLCATNENLTDVMRAAFSGKGIVMEEGAMNPAHYVPADSPFVRTLLESYERYFGKKGIPMAIGGGTYVHGLKRGVAFGCMVEGTDNHMHGDDEFMEIETLTKSAKIFADAIMKICSMDEA